MGTNERALLERYAAIVRPERIVMSLQGEAEVRNYLSIGAAILAIKDHRRAVDMRAFPPVPAARAPMPGHREQEAPRVSVV